MAITTNVYQNVISRSLRVCQREAIQKITDYTSQVFAQKSCLICLPTGAGKTGVIAVISQLDNFNKVLIISHRRAVTDQLKREIKRKFFKKINPEHEFELKSVFELDQECADNGVYVTTFHKLQILTNAMIDNISTQIDLVIVDEGHAEPAEKWSSIIRRIQKHKVIVTATPYRNDLFQFDIGNFNYSYSFTHAVRDQIILMPNFIVFDNNRKCLINYVHDYLAENISLKVLIKCNSKDDINSYFEDFFSLNYPVLAVHEDFKSDHATESKKAQVPINLNDSKFKVIIYQYKLDEGVDIPSAKLLILTYPVSNGRQLVQSIGRIVRKDNDNSALVLDLSNGSNKLLWDNYINFDSCISNADEWSKFVNSLDSARIIDNYLDIFSEYNYSGMSFKKRFNFNELDAKNISIPLVSVCFYKKYNNFSISNFSEKLRFELSRNGELVRIIDHIINQPNLLVVMSVCFTNSKYLSQDFFLEPSLEFVIIKANNDLVAIYDSRSALLHKWQ